MQRMPNTILTFRPVFVGMVVVVAGIVNIALTHGSDTEPAAGGVEAWIKAGFELKAKDDAKGSDTNKPSGSSASPNGSGTR